MVAPESQQAAVEGGGHRAAEPQGQGPQDLPGHQVVRARRAEEGRGAPEGDEGQETGGRGCQGRCHAVRAEIAIVLRGEQGPGDGRAEDCGQGRRRARHHHHARLGQ